MKQSTLELKQKKRKIVSGQIERDFLDFVVDGKSLHEILETSDLIGCLGWGQPEIENTLLRNY